MFGWTAMNGLLDLVDGGVERGNKSGGLAEHSQGGNGLKILDKGTAIAQKRMAHDYDYTIV